MPSSKAKQQRWNIRRKRYPKNWATIKANLRTRSGGQCECTGECGSHLFERCVERHGEAGKTMRGTVYLQAMHLNHQPEDTRLEVLMDGCPGCHLRYDKLHHATNSRKTRAAEKSQIDCIDEHEKRTTAMHLRLHLEANPMKTILIPAPDCRQVGHKIRVNETKPPKWYIEIASRWGYDSKRRGRFERLHFLANLKLIEDGIPPFRRGSPYYDAAAAIVQKAIEVPEEVFCGG